MEKIIMKRLFGLIIASIIVTIMLAGCEKNTSEPVAESDESVVTQLAQNEGEEYLLDEGIDDGNEDNMYDGYSSFGQITTPIDSVFRFGRKIRDRPVRVVTDVRRISPDSIAVFVRRVFAGQFVVFSKEVDTTGGFPPITIYRKHLRHEIRRGAIYERRPPNDTGRRWKLASVSLGQGNSVPYSTIEIKEISISSSSGVNVVYTDPLHTMLNIPEDILTFNPGDLITVQLKLTNSTASPVDPFGTGSTETVLLHYGVNHRHHARKRFEYVGSDNGDQVYQGTWTIGQEPFRVYHTVVDAIDNGTIYNDDGTAYPYNSATWNAPYRVVERD
jgi:hypothetical protein